MAGMWGTFEDVRRGCGIVVILMVVAFFMGFCAGGITVYKVSQSEANVEPKCVPDGFVDCK